VTNRKTRQPTHPGLVLRDITFPALKVNISQAAREMAISRQSLHKILAGERSITAEMAVRIGKYCGNGPKFWMRMQSAHDLWVAEGVLAEQVKGIPTHKVA
jgi:addiction module HigA family antidote